MESTFHSLSFTETQALYPPYTENMPHQLKTHEASEDPTVAVHTPTSSFSNPSTDKIMNRKAATHQHHPNNRTNNIHNTYSSAWSSRAWRQPSRNNPSSNPLQETAEQAAASALLIAAGGPRKEEVDRLQHQQQQQQKQQRKEEGAAALSSSTNHTRSLTTQQRTAAESSELAPPSVCHVSPHSTDGDGAVIGRKGGGGGVRVAQEVVIPDFPAKLHRVLTKSDFSGTVLEWLPTGTSWRVLRWNELSTAVIPKHFPELLQDESHPSRRRMDGNDDEKEEEITSIRMDRFLYQIKAHGFDEIRNVGPDMGAYRHEVGEMMDMHRSIFIHFG